MQPLDLPVYSWPDLAAVERQYVVVDDHGRYGIAVYDPVHHRNVLFARPIDLPDEVAAPADLGLPRGAVLMTPTVWHLEPDGRYSGLWYDDGRVGQIKPEDLRCLTIVDDLGWVMPDRWAAQALAGSAGAGVWNYGGRLGIIPGQPPVPGQTGDEMAISQAEEYAREVGQPVTAAAIARAAASGLIPGARQVGADWLIPYAGMNSYLDNPAVALGRKGGSATSAAKTEAARANARKGGWQKGRPRKSPPTETE